MRNTDGHGIRNREWHPLMYILCLLFDVIVLRCMCTSFFILLVSCHLCKAVGPVHDRDSWPSLWPRPVTTKLLRPMIVPSLPSELSTDGWLARTHHPSLFYVDLSCQCTHILWSFQTRLTLNNSFHLNFSVIGWIVGINNIWIKQNYATPSKPIC
jgi:hypothetical protein